MPVLIAPAWRACGTRAASRGGWRGETVVAWRLISVTGVIWASVVKAMACR